MLRKKNGSLEWLEFELFQEFPNLRHAIFLRHGGVSEGPYASLNAGGGSGDDHQSIESNRETIRRLLGCSKLVGSKQVHGKLVETVPFTKELVECDGLITNQKDMGLFIKHADCQAAIMYDPVQGALGCIHAGWRGNVQNIYAEAIKKMEIDFGSKPENILVGVSPSLGPCCGEFVNYRAELPEEFLPFQIKPLYFDLWEIGRSQLIKAGILPHHIEIASICTRCNPDDYFSYRREKASGRHATVAVLISDKR
jgi:polyphenol oxidase